MHTVGWLAGAISALFPCKTKTGVQFVLREWKHRCGWRVGLRGSHQHGACYSARAWEELYLLMFMLMPFLLWVDGGLGPRVLDSSIPCGEALFQRTDGVKATQVSKARTMVVRAKLTRTGMHLRYYRQ